LKAEISSPRLVYERVSLATLHAFHSLVVDAHVRRYLMDDTIFPREWTEERVRDSEALFVTRGVGLWLARELASGTLAGFCGFLELPSVHPDPQLVYALLEPFTGRGYATEMASAAIAHARRQPGFDEIIAAVDDVNTASLRVIEKLGFAKAATAPGQLGSTSVFRLVNDGLSELNPVR
jgi:[ribosomal protein S5]-alanine N-acetyltransferase